MAYWGEAIIGVSSLLSGLLDDSNQIAARAQTDAASISRTPRLAYPGQKTIAGNLAPYLWESVGKGLTEEEKNVYRGEGRTNILQSVRGAQNTAAKTYAAQGLKGGTVANALTNINKAALPEFTKMETNLFGLGEAKKKQSIADILNFLSLSKGEEEGESPAATGQTIASIINNLVGGGGINTGGSDDGGLGSRSPGVSGPGGSFGWSGKGAVTGATLGSKLGPIGTLLGLGAGGLAGGYEEGYADYADQYGFDDTRFGDLTPESYGRGGGGYDDNVSDSSSAGPSGGGYG